MNREQFATTVAKAYVNQFSTDGHYVMNEVVIIWDGTQFSSQSSLTPNSEILVMSLEEGIFGDISADDPEAEQAIAEYLVDSASDEGWQDVIAIIDQAQADVDAWAAEEEHRHYDQQ